MAENDENRVIISRQQQRRGQKQDLPQPLRPAEFGFTTDSRQVFIGADPLDQTATYLKAHAEFEITLNAKEHTVSIAENQLMAFTVPFIKYSRGKFDGISRIRLWEPNDARSSIPVGKSCDHISSEYSVFSDFVTGTYAVTVAADAPGDDRVVIDYSGSFSSNPLRVGDAIAAAGLEREVPSIPIKIFDIEEDTDNGSTVRIRMRGFKQPVGSLAAGDQITVSPQSVKNVITGLPFTSEDVIVSKNGIRLVPDSDITNKTTPSSNVDYVFDGGSGIVSDTHSITFRSAPQPTDDITISYYGQEDIVQAFEGIEREDGKKYISSTSDVESFYSAYNIPEYLQFDRDRIKLSVTTGLGFIGLEKKQISPIAYGLPIDDPQSLSLGEFYIGHTDNMMYANTVVIDSVSDRQVYTFTTPAPSVNPFTPIGDTTGDTTYRYNRVAFQKSSETDPYINQIVWDVIAVDNSSGNITISAPAVDFTIHREADAILSNKIGNNYGTGPDNGTIIQITTADTEGIKQNDWVRVIDTSGNPAGCELHNVIFQVTDVPKETSFNVVISAATVHPNSLSGGQANVDFTTNDGNVAIINHGTGDPENLLQFYSPQGHRIATDPGFVRVIFDNPDIFDNSTDYSVSFDPELRDSSKKTILVSAPMPDPTQAVISGQYLPKMANEYTDLMAMPVLTVDLSSASTINDVLNIINKDLVEIKNTGLEFVEDEIFPELTIVPGTNNQLILKQDPSYSGVASGGVEFVIFEDHDNNTLANLGFVEGDYTRAKDTVKGKLELWLNDIVANRDVNIFSRVMSAGSVVTGFQPVPRTYNDYTTLSNINLGNATVQYKPYILSLDVFDDLEFCDRQEAGAFVDVVNKAYAESLFDRRTDFYDGVRLLLNMKDNIELLTKDTYESLLAENAKNANNNVSEDANSMFVYETFSFTVPKNKEANEYVFGFELGTDEYNNFIIDYTITDINDDQTGPNPANKYSRTGQMRVEARDDFIQNPEQAVIVYDEFSSQWDINNPIGGIDDVYEPWFDAIWESTANEVWFFFKGYPTFTTNPYGGAPLAFSMNSDLYIQVTIRKSKSTPEIVMP